MSVDKRAFGTCSPELYPGQHMMDAVFGLPGDQLSPAYEQTESTAARILQGVALPALAAYIAATGGQVATDVIHQPAEDSHVRLVGTSQHPIGLYSKAARTHGLQRSRDIPEIRKYTYTDTYDVQNGDTFWDLENAWHLPHGTLERLNPHADPLNLQVGHNIQRPSESSLRQIATFQKGMEARGGKTTGFPLDTEQLPQTDDMILIGGHMGVVDGVYTHGGIVMVRAEMTMTHQTADIPLGSIEAVGHVPQDRSPHDQTTHLRPQADQPGGLMPTTAERMSTQAVTARQITHGHHVMTGRVIPPNHAHYEGHVRTAAQRTHIQQRRQERVRQHPGAQARNLGSTVIPGTVSPDAGSKVHPDKGMSLIPGFTAQDILQANWPNTNSQPVTANQAQSGSNNQKDKLSQIAAEATQEKMVRDAIVRAALSQYSQFGGKDFYGYQNIQDFTGKSQYEQWCSDLVSLVMKLSGHPFNGGNPGNRADIYRVANMNGSPPIPADTLQQWYEQHGKFWWNEGQRKPKPGDVFFMGSKGDLFHTGVIVAVDGNIITTIEGDATSSYILHKGTYDISNPGEQIAAFGSLFAKHINVMGQSQPSHDTQPNDGQHVGNQLLSNIPGLPILKYVTTTQVPGESLIPGTYWLQLPDQSHGHQGSPTPSHEQPPASPNIVMVNGHWEWRSHEQGPHSVEDYNIQVLKALAARMGIPESHTLTQEHMIALTAWAILEGGNITNNYHWNLWNSGIKRSYLVDGVPHADGTQSYQSFDKGITAQILAFTGSNQTRIAHILSNPHSSAEQVLWTIAYWNHFTGNKIWAGLSPADYYGRLLNTLSQARLNYAQLASTLVGPSFVGGHYHADPSSLKFHSPNAVRGQRIHGVIVRPNGHQRQNLHAKVHRSSPHNSPAPGRSSTAPGHARQKQTPRAKKGAALIPGLVNIAPHTLPGTDPAQP